MAWSSQASALSGQPWLNTTGCPEPQSLWKICVPSLVAIVPIGLLLLVIYGLWVVGLGRCA